MVEICKMESGSVNILKTKAVGTNVSSEGMEVVSYLSMEEGNVVKVFFPIDDGSVKIPVFAEVIWVEISGGKYRAVLRFLG